MAAETVDTLELVISARATDAAESVGRLATSVSKFGESVAKHVNALGNFADVLKKISEAASGLSAIKNLQSVFSKAAAAAGKMKEKTSAGATAVPPKSAWLIKKPNSEIKARTRYVNASDGTTRKFEHRSSDIASSINRQYGGSSLTNKALSAKIQEIRQMVLNGDEQAMKELTELAGEIAKSAGAKRNISPMIALLNGEFAKNYIGTTEKDVRGTGMSVGAMNALAKSLGAKFRFKPFEGNRNSYGMRGLDEMDEEMLRSVGVDTPNVEDLIAAMEQEAMHGGVGHKQVLDENFARDNQELQAQILDELVDKVYANSVVTREQEGKKPGAVQPADIVPPAVTEAVDKAKEEADEARRISKEMDEAWRGQKGWEREQSARYKEDYGGKEKKWQMEADWREHDRMNAPEEDRTAQEIAAWKDEEDEKYFADMGRVAEGVKEAATVGPTQDLQSFVNEITGVSREMSDASESAGIYWKAIAEGTVDGITQQATMGLQEFVDGITGVSREMRSAEDAAGSYWKAIAEGAVNGSLKEATMGTQKFIDNMTGVSREMSNAESSAQDFIKKFQEEEEAERQASEARRAEFEQLREWGARKDAERAEEARMRDLKGFVSDSTPEMLQRNVNLFGQDKMRELLPSFPQRTNEALAEGLIDESTANQMLEIMGYMREIPEAARKAREQVSALMETLNTPIKANWAESIDRMLGIGAKPKSAEESMSVFMQAMQEDNATAASTRDLNPELQQFCEEAKNAGVESNNLTTQLVGLDGELKQKKKDAKGAADGLNSVGESAKNAENKVGGIKGAFKALWETIKSKAWFKVGEQLFKTAKARLFREAVKAVGKALKEGTDNLYQWSKANKGHFAGSMDTIATKLTLMKNSVATAVSPLIESLVPALNTVANVVTWVTEKLAQFFALMNGQTSWTKATESAQEWAAAAGTGANNTNKAAKEAKDLLADWDELNIIQQEASDTDTGGGGGSGKKAVNYKDMFEETAFENWTKHFDSIKATAETIWTIISAWFKIKTINTFIDKLSGISSKVDAISGKLKDGFTGAIMLYAGFKLATEAGKNVADNGFTWGAFVQEAIGLIAAGFGGQKLASAFGVNPVVGVTMGIGLALVATYLSYENARNENAQEYIREHLESEVFHFDVDAVADDIKVTINDASKARKATEKAVETVMVDLEVLKLGIDDGKTWEKIKEDVLGENGLVNKLQAELDQDKSVITMYYDVKKKTATKPTAGAEGASSDAASQDASAYMMDLQLVDEIKGYYTGLGEQFAECFEEGQNGKLKEGMKDTAAQIIESMIEAKSAAETEVSKWNMKLAMTKALDGADPEAVMRNLRKTILSETKKVADISRNNDAGYVETMLPLIAEYKKLHPDGHKYDDVEERVRQAQERLLANKYEEQTYNAYGGQYSEFVKGLIDKFIDVNKLQTSGFMEGTSPFDQLESFLPGVMDLIKDFDLKLDDFLPENIIAGYFEHFLNESGGDAENARKMLEGLVSEDLLNKLVGGKVGEDLKAKAAEEATKAAESAAAAETAEAEARKAAEEVKAELGNEPINAVDKAEIDAEITGGIQKKDITVTPEVEAWNTLEDWFDTYKNLNDDNMDEEFELWGKVMDLFGDNSPLLHVLSEYITNGASPESLKGFENLSDVNDLFTHWMPDELKPDTSWGNAPSEPVTVNATESGMAMDSTVTNLSNVSGEGFTTLEGIMKTLGRTMEDVAGNTKALVGKNWTLIMSPSSGLGGIVQRGAAMYNAVTGGP